VYNTLN